MFVKLKSLVFGFEEYEKTKIEIRFAEIKQLLNNIEINSLSDFEILEECLYKIREQLRIKSSNINSSIRKGVIKKKEIIFVIESLNEKKYNFLKKVFKLIETQSDENKQFEKNIKNQDTHLEDVDNHSKIQNSLDNRRVENLENKNFSEASIEQEKLDEKNKNNFNKEEYKEIKEKNPIEKLDENDKYISMENIFEDFPKKNKKEKFIETKIEILKNSDFQIFLENGKEIFILINFTEKINYSIIKIFASLLFDTYHCHGTNILIENNKVLIIARFMNDNLINLPKINSNIDKVYSKLIENKNEINQNLGEKIDKSQIKQEKNEEFLEINNPQIKQENTLKIKEDSLDDLLSSLDKKKKNNKVIEEKEERKIVFLKEDEDDSKIITEKKENEIKEEEIILEKNKIDSNIKNEEKFNSKENIFDDEKKISLEENKIKEKEIILEKNKIDSNIKNEEKFLIYGDDKIKVILDENSKILGKIDIYSQNKEKIKNLNEGDLSYMMIFSKVFASVLFEVKDSQGTNIIWNHNDSKISIITRNENDNLNLKWELTQASSDFLDKVKDRLFEEMHKGIKKEEKINIFKEEKAKIGEVKKEETHSLEELQEKAKNLLEAIRKIP